MHLDVIEEIGLITLWSNEKPPIGYGYTRSLNYKPPSFNNPQFRSKAKGKTFLVKMSDICMRI